MDTRTSLKSLNVIEPRRGWRKLNFRETWSYRNLIVTLVSRDLKSRYRKTIFGPLWFIISPLMDLVVMSFVFGELAKLDSNGLPYPVFYYSAVLPWNLFKVLVTQINNSTLQFMPWMTKIYVPPLIAPITTLSSAFINWSMSLLVLFGLMLYYHIEMSVSLIFIPFYLLITFITALSVGLLGAAFTVRFRDIGSLVGFLLTAWYYVTPVIYSVNIIPENFQWLFDFNPMYWVVEGFRWALLGTGTAPQINMLYSFSFFIILLVFGLFVHERASRNIVDIH